MTIVIAGAGPAGLTAAYCLVRLGEKPVVFEADDVVGGIARTVEADGWRFDIGGHRFFTKVSAVEQLWFEMLPAEDWLVRPRGSHILYRDRFYEYPLRVVDVLRNLGIIETGRCIASYLWCRVRPPKDQTTFEGWVTARFGRRLYDMFFRTYTEKVWGVPGSEIRADWAAQRIKSLSLWEAVRDALRIRRRTTNTDVTSLIAEFHYPRLGPGMLWERCHRTVEESGATVHLSAEIVEVSLVPGIGAVSVGVRHADGTLTEQPCRHLVSSMPLPQLARSIRPAPPADVLAAADGLRFRQFVVVALVVPESAAFDGQWIYVHTPGVRVGRVQNFGAWSPELVRPGTACLGLEYFVDEDDDLWTADDSWVVEFAVDEIGRLGIARADEVQAGHVVRMPKAYPMYDDTYRQHVDTIRTWIAEHAPNIHPVGRNGMHRYNNQDHSMFTAMLTVDNVVTGTDHDIWAVNVDEEYHEERRQAPTPGTTPVP